MKTARVCYVMKDEQFRLCMTIPKLSRGVTLRTQFNGLGDRLGAAKPTANLSLEAYSLSYKAYN